MTHDNRLASLLAQVKNVFQSSIEIDPLHKLYKTHKIEQFN